MTMKRSRQRRYPAIPRTWAETLKRCPHRTIIAGRVRHGTVDLLPPPLRVLAVISGDPTPLNSAMMAEIVASGQAGETVMILSDRADLRDYAKREILALVLPAVGRA